MKALGITASTASGIFLVIYIFGWIVVITEHGAAEGVRIGFTLWPGNLIGLVVLALVIVFGAAGVILLREPRQKQPRVAD